MTAPIRDHEMEGMEHGTPSAPPRPLEEGIQILPAAGERDAAEPARRKPRNRRKTAARLNDPDWLRKISWSKESRPGSPLADLISDGQVECDGLDSIFRQWDQAGRPLCLTCRNRHPGPHLPKGDDDVRRMKPALLAKYKAEQAEVHVPAVNPPPLAVDAPADVQQPADAEAEKPVPKKKKEKHHYCDRCKKWHKNECNVPDCEKCGAAHYPTVGCKPTAQRLDLFAAFLGSVNNKAAMEKAGELFSREFGDSTANSSPKKKSKGKKRKAQSEGDNATGKKRR